MYNEAMRNYTEMVWARLGITPLQEGIGNRVALQAAFLPSFHPEVAIELERSHEGWSIELRTCGTNLYQHQQCQAALAKGEKPGWDAPQEPTLNVKRGNISGEIANSMSQLLSTTRLSEWGDGGLGLDGMTLHCTHRNNDGVVERAEVWMRGEQEAPVSHKLANALFDAATSLLPDSVVQLALEGLHGYLDRGLPAAVAGDNPTTARIFGGLSTREEDDLAEFLRGLPVGAPVLVDMSNFGHMGTLLYPCFQQFAASRKAPTAWLVNKAARKQLSDAGIALETMADTRDAALELLS